MAVVPGIVHRPRVSRAAGHARTLPAWWRELLVVLVIYGAYDTTRGLHIGNLATAETNGGTLLRWEKSWHLAPEHALNQALWHAPALAVIAAYFYATLHYVVTPAVLVWLYRRHPEHYLRARTTLAVATVTALAGFWLLPTAPPRLLAGGGFHDTLADVHGWGWWGGEGSVPRGIPSGFTNQFAAMPSMHVGWALWCGVLIARYARRPVVRIIGASYPVLTTLVVMGTGNHYLLDAVGGVAIMALAATVVTVVGRQRGRTGPDQPPYPGPGARPDTLTPWKVTSF
jgi:hypothetical protein